MRWPRQQLRDVLSARTLRSSGTPAGGGTPRKGTGAGRAAAGPTVDRGAHRVDDAAEPALGRSHRRRRRGHHGAAAAADTPRAARTASAAHWGPRTDDLARGSAGRPPRWTPAHRPAWRAANPLLRPPGRAPRPRGRRPLSHRVGRSAPRGLHVGGGGGLILPTTKSSPLTLTSRLPGSLIIASPSLGTRVSPARTEGASRPNRLLPILKVDYEH